MYLLFDCNNFFASCEQIFRPDWRRKPLVVLSNNDGCIISRSAEAKALGFAMGEPHFKCKDKIAATGTIVCSTNFALYGDISDRIMSILEEALPQVEQYSIDEAFAHVGPEKHQDWQEVSRQLRKRIRQWTGVTVSVGIAPSKTLAKLANVIAKKDPQYKASGLLALREADDWQNILKHTPVGDIWGVGKRLEVRMKALGLLTAADLATADLDLLRRSFGVIGERLALELRGIDCHQEASAATRGQIMVSRSLKTGISDKESLRGVLCQFMEKAARMLRAEGLTCQRVHLILRQALAYQESSSQPYLAERGLQLVTEDTRELSKIATELLDCLWQEGYDYKKVGVMLSELSPRDAFQPSFEQSQLPSPKLMNTLDALQIAGHHIHFANVVQEKLWHKEFSSRLYTTDWGQIPDAR